MAVFDLQDLDIYCVVGIIFILLLFFFCIKKNSYEHMRSIGDIDFPDIYEDTILYSNTEDGRLGIDQCYEKCSGNCLEYGVTGDAFCFPAE